MSSTTASHAFAPDYNFPPGEHLAEWLEENHVSQTQLADRTGLSRKHISQLINGEATLSTDVAMALERVTGMPARLWNRLEADFRTWEAGQVQRRSLADTEHLEWAASFPTSDLKKRRLLPDVEAEDLVEALLRMFGVNSIESWRRVYESRAAGVAYRVATGDRQFTAVSAWLRACDLRASHVRTASFDRTALLEFATTVRHLSVLEPEPMWRQLVDGYARCGVSLVLEREFPAATKLNGASWWESPHRAVIAVTGRMKKADSLLFTILHETAHLVFHAKKAVYIDIESSQTVTPELEDEANARASHWLIPADEWQDIRRIPLRRNTLGIIRNKAQEYGVHPGILVGQLQHATGVWNIGSSLKQPLKLSEPYWNYPEPDR